MASFWIGLLLIRCKVAFLITRLKWYRTNRLDIAIVVVGFIVLLQIYIHSTFISFCYLDKSIVCIEHTNDAKENKASLVCSMR